MKKTKILGRSALMIAALLPMLLTGCKAPSPEATAPAQSGAEISEPAKNSDIKKVDLADGVYSAVFTTDSGMFRVNEANAGKGVLTVRDGQAMIHISLGSKKIVNLFAGSAEEAQKEGAALLEPTVDSVTYSDGTTEEVHGFDVPVPALDEEFAVALIGTKGVWYDHMVSVSDPTPMDGADTAAN